MVTVLPIITNPDSEESKLHFSKSVRFVFHFSRALHFYLFITHLKVKNQVARTFVVHLALFYVLDSNFFFMFFFFVRSVSYGQMMRHIIRVGARSCDTAVLTR